MRDFTMKTTNIATIQVDYNQVTLNTIKAKIS